MSNIKDSINYAFSGKLSDMSDSLDAAIKEKLSGALEQKKVEISKSLLGGYSEQVREDINESTEESFEDLLETLSPEMGAEKYIHDFVHSDNPKFEGKSKKERIQMALGAYYSAKKGKTRNEEVEELDEVSRKLMLQYLQANKASKNPNSPKRIKGTQTAVGKWTGNYGKVPATGEKEGVIAGKPSKTKNEEVEELDELSTDTMQSYVDKKQQIVGKKRDAGISLAKKKISKIEKDKKKYINARKW